MNERRRLSAVFAAALLLYTSAVPVLAGAAADAPSAAAQTAGGTRQADVPLLDGPRTVDGEGTVALAVDLPEERALTLRLTYAFFADADPQKASVSVLLDGRPAADGASDIGLSCRYEDAEPIRQDLRGNDILPEQRLSTAPVSAVLCDSAQLGRQIPFTIPAGRHELTLAFSSTKITLTDVCLTDPALPSYEQYRAGCPAGSAGDVSVTVQAEQAALRSTSSLLPGTDRSGPATVPSDPVAKKLNVIAAGRWKDIGASLTWRIDVPADGRYRIGLRWKQDTKEGLATFRALYLDGEIPFAEAAELRFPYGRGWQYTCLGDAEGESYEFYLTAGTHMMTLEAVSGKMAEPTAALQETVYRLNTLYRRIIMVTGVSPDPYRDHDLFTQIDDLQQQFSASAASLDELIGQIGAVTGSKGGQISALAQLQKQLAEFAQDDLTIPDRLDAFKNNIVAAAALVTSFYEQPLSLDFITLTGEAAAEPEGLRPGLFDSLSYHLSAFFGSFFHDYSAVGDQTSSAVELTAWYGGSREQAEILKQLIDGGFTGQTGIGVRLQLVAIPLSQAILAGTAPDVLLTTSRGQPVNLGIRGALMDLSACDGVEEMKAEYAPQAFVPYTCRGALYGIPVTMSFHMMFVRTDIFAELGLSVPDTWDDLDTTVARLQRTNMTVGLPYSVMSSAASIEAGMGCKDIFSALLLQNGGRIYNDAQDATVLDEEATMAAFRRWTAYYTTYQLDTQYDFYNRFRTGEMPIGIGDYSFYNTLQAAAPELKGLWTMTVIPGTRRPDGSVDRTEAASGSACVIVKDTPCPNEAWQLLRWWCSAAVQGRFGSEIELQMGTAARYAPANRNALRLLPWSEEQLDLLERQAEQIEEIPEVIGGYYTARGLDNAFRNVLFNAVNYREALLEQMDIINTELARKQKEFS